jgi:hypothetical protein
MNHTTIVDEDPRPEERRAQHALTELNQRIARLSMVLGAPLESMLDFENILNRHTTTMAKHVPGGTPSTNGSSSEARLDREWEELRGLLLLRCDLMAHMLESLGMDTAMEVAANVETHMVREGFKPGADGFELLQHLSRDPGDSGKEKV